MCATVARSNHSSNERAASCDGTDDRDTLAERRKPCVVSAAAKHDTSDRISGSSPPQRHLLNAGFFERGAVKSCARASGRIKAIVQCCDYANEIPIIERDKK